MLDGSWAKNLLEVHLEEVDAEVAGLGGVAVKEPGVHEQAQFVGDAERFGDETQVLGSDPGGAVLPSLVVAIVVASAAPRLPRQSLRRLTIGHSRHAHRPDGRCFSDPENRS